MSRRARPTVRELGAAIAQFAVAAYMLLFFGLLVISHSPAAYEKWPVLFDILGFPTQELGLFPRGGPDAPLPITFAIWAASIVLMIGVPYYAGCFARRLFDRSS